MAIKLPAVRQTPLKLIHVNIARQITGDHCADLRLKHDGPTGLSKQLANARPLQRGALQRTAS